MQADYSVVHTPMGRLNQDFGITMAWLVKSESTARTDCSIGRVGSVNKASPRATLVLGFPQEAGMTIANAGSAGEVWAGHTLGRMVCVGDDAPLTAFETFVRP